MVCCFDVVLLRSGERRPRLGWRRSWTGFFLSVGVERSGEVCMNVS